VPDIRLVLLERFTGTNTNTFTMAHDDARGTVYLHLQLVLEVVMLSLFLMDLQICC
jgi:hypothetical protein